MVITSLFHPTHIRKESFYRSWRPVHFGPGHPSRGLFDHLAEL